MRMKTSYEVKTKKMQRHERAVTSFSCKVINTILAHNAFWQITTQGIRVVWLGRTWPHTWIMITSPPAHAPPATLLLQDIWWEDKLRRCIDTLFFPTVNVSLRRKQRPKKDVGGAVPTLPSGTGCQSHSLIEEDEGGASLSGALWNQKWPINELSGVVSFYRTSLMILFNAMWSLADLFPKNVSEGLDEGQVVQFLH